jgi:glycosyltransferase involved in cell wall biosynthesis
VAFPLESGRSAPPVVHLSMRFTHHGGHSGYDRISAYMPEATVVRRLRIGPIWPIYRRVFQRLVKPWSVGFHPYGAENMLLELNAYRHARRHRGSVYHFLYGEESFRLLRLKSSALVASFHQPPSILRAWRVAGHYLKRLSAVVILAEMQRRYFEEFLPAASIHRVPHGIDTDFFAPAAPAPKGPTPAAFRCLTVGSWLRDHETLRATIQSFQANPGPMPIAFDIVGQPASKQHYADCPLVTYHTHLSDSDLLALYRRADLTVLALTDSVANNALMEAMACGRPIVVTDVGGIREYADDSCAAFVPPRDPSALRHTIEDLQAAPARRAQLGETARRQALRYNWKRVVARMRDVYAEVELRRAP